MSFLSLKKEKEAMSGIVREAMEFVEASGQTYDAFAKKSEGELLGSLSVWKTSTFFKIKTGEALREKILEALGKESVTAKRVTLTDLLAAVDKEIRNLSGIHGTLLELQAAKDAEKMISEREDVLKFKMAVEKNKQAQSNQEGGR